MESALLDTPSDAAGPDLRPEEDVDRLVALYRRAGRSLRANDPSNWAEGLTMPRLRVLFTLGRTGPVPVGQIATILGISQPSATETLDKLVAKGLVERTADSNDRRIVLVGLTETGREMIDRPWETRRAVLAIALRDASPDERAAIERGLILLVDALEKAERTDMMNGVERA